MDRDEEIEKYNSKMFLAMQLIERICQKYSTFY